jgi:hypothetical protein
MRPQAWARCSRGDLWPCAVDGRGAFGGADYRLSDRYPALALEWMAAKGSAVGPCIASLRQEIVGNLINLLYGADSGLTYYDDRFDMFPEDCRKGSCAARGARLADGSRG